MNKYMLELKKLLQTCEFGDNLNDIFRDGLVCQLKLEHIQKRLLFENNLTYSKAFEITVSIEMTERDAYELKQSPTSR